jgi:hypothetical protein
VSRRAAAAAAALAATAALLGCPIPQPVNEYPNATAIPPPRILMDGVKPAGPVLWVKADCPAPAVFTLSASINDDNTIEAVSYRWFLDYDGAGPPACNPVLGSGVVQPAANGGPVRVVPPLAFDAVGSLAPQPGDVHVVELVLSNGFVDPSAGTCLWRTPQPNFETQTYRWVFRYVGPADPQYPTAPCGYTPPPP